MATAAGEIKLEYGVPQVFGLKFLQARITQGSYGDRAMYTATDERKLWIDADDASDLERQMRELGVQRGEPIQVTKIRMARGGGHAIRVERPGAGAQSWQTNAPAPDPVHQGFNPANQAHGNTRTSMEDQLERSVQLARRDPSAFQQNRHVQQPVVEATRLPMLETKTTTQLIARALIASIDAYKIAADYAKANSIPVTLNLEFNAEDVRASATSTLIEYWRSGGTQL